MSNGHILSFPFLEAIFIYHAKVTEPAVRKTITLSSEIIILEKQTCVSILSCGMRRDQMFQNMKPQNFVLAFCFELRGVFFYENLLNQSEASTGRVANFGTDKLCPPADLTLE